MWADFTDPKNSANVLMLTIASWIMIVLVNLELWKPERKWMHVLKNMNYFVGLESKSKIPKATICT